MDTFLWQTEFDNLLSVELWNLNVLPLMRERGDDFKKFAHAEAKARGYKYNAEKAEYIEGPIPVTGTKGRNLTAVGWRNGILRCVFERERNNISIYAYGDKENPVPKEEYLKLLKSPFPDKLFTQIVKSKYPCTKEGGA